MTRQDAITEEVRRYLAACYAASLFRRCNNHTDAQRAQHLAHIHLLTIGRLRGQSVAPWVRHADLWPTAVTGGTR